ncbi:MCE family protein [Nocardioides humi]|uniref:MlaD family protein n=1 Tax=Nocardioides humi TaxID=449461 RepID=A0ABN2AXN0_9ACTN|nr:MlaD family protein [Nocardioides humi]
MLNLTAKAKLITFMVLAMVTTTFLAAQYVGLDRYVGGYRVTVDLPEAGGLFDNSEVTYRGVPVGRVESLDATRGGARAVVRIKPGAPDMPAGVEARVVNRSAIGEQYLDLRGGKLDGERLGEGDRIAVRASGLPPSLDGLLRSSRDFVASVPSDALTTVIDETYDLTRGNGTHLARLVETSAEFARTADKNFLVSASLIRSSGTVLATQEAAADSFQSFSKDMSLLAHALADQDDAWRELIAQTPEAARELGLLFDGVGQPLGTLMSNMVSTAQIFGTNAAGVKETLIKLPEGISITYAVMTSKGLRMGVTPTFFSPMPCVTGYGATPLRTGLDTSPGQPFNTGAGCTLSPSSGVNVRGPGAVSKGGRR